MRRAAALILAASFLSVTACSAEPRGFAPDTVLPEREAVLAHVSNGQAGRDLMTAVFDGDHQTVKRRLEADPRLKDTSDGGNGDLLGVAVAQQDKGMVDLLLGLGVPPDGPHGQTPLIYALRAQDPWYATRLLDAGATPDPLPNGRSWPLREAVLLTSEGAITLLLRHGAHIDWADSAGETALEDAADSQAFRMAEVLLKAGADPWTVDVNGGTVASAAVRPLVRPTVEEQAAQARVVELLKAKGWPWPPPDMAEVRKAVMAGRWPPVGVRGVAPSPQVLATMRANWNPDGTKRAR